MAVPFLNWHKLFATRAGWPGNLSGMPSETVSARDIGGLKRSRGEGPAVEFRIAELARRQYGVVARSQLKKLGLGEDAIDHRLAIGRLHRLYRGVYGVGHRLIPRQGWWMAAVLASAPFAVLSHRSAAAHWELLGYSEGAVHVTVAHKSTSTKQIRRHHASPLADEITVKGGIPVTTPPRTLLDLAATEPAEVIEKLLREVEYRELRDRLSLLDMVDRYPGRRGVQKLRLALERIKAEPPGRRREGLEERFAPFLGRHRLPLPRFNDWISLGGKNYQVDCHWPGSGQIVELDGWTGHGTRSAFRNDRARDRALRVAGYSVTRITWSQLNDEPGAIAADLRTLLAVAMPA
jgi:very-short-patch-repair endonuclease